MIDEIRTLLARNLPEYEIRSVTGLGEGLDNAAHEVNGELIVRTSKETDPARRAASTRREADLLAVAASISTLPVPEPVFADPEAGAIAYRSLPGLPLMDRPVAEPPLLAPELGRFLGHLHGASLEKLEGLVERDLYHLAAWLEDAEEDYRGVSKRLPAEARRQIEDFLEHSPPAEPQTLAFCHNDLGAEHVLVDTEANAVTGIIDWGDAAITDPARDLALVYRDLGPEVFELTLAHYGGDFDDADRERAIFYARCKLVEDLAYGLGNPGAERYAEVGLCPTSTGPSGTLRRAPCPKRRPRMSELKYFVACSVDGFIAGEDGSTDAFVNDEDYLVGLFETFPETCPAHLRRALDVRGENRHFDTVLMGRNTYEPGLEIGLMSPYPTLDQYVFSTTMEESPDGEVTPVSEDATGLVRGLKAERGKDIWLAGGATLAASLLSEGLIDELMLKVNPVVLGSGILLFSGRTKKV